MNKPKRNYQRELDKLIEDPAVRGRKVLLHSCCAPCSSYCMEYLREYFALTVFFYNPNITENAEYQKRVEEEKRLIRAFNREREQAAYVNSDEKRKLSPIAIIEGDYEPECFFEIAKGLEGCPEGGERCRACYELRLRKTAETAAELGFDYFTTTLTISPLKNADWLNEIGEKLALEYQVAFLPSDFKKKNGYKRSIELSTQYELYRQDYCGCAYSKAERMRRKAEAAFMFRPLT